MTFLFFCGGIPNVFSTLKSYEQFLPKGSLETYKFIDEYYLKLSDNYIKFDRLSEIKFSFREYLFPENSHLGMIAPSIMIYLLHISFTKNVNKFLQITTCLFIFVCLIKSSTTLFVGTISSLVLLITFNFKVIPKNTLVAFSCILIIFSAFLISSEECRKRFVPIYGYMSHGPQDNTFDMKKKDVVGEINPKFASKLKDIMGTSGGLSSGVYFHALMIAKKSIFEKPFGWGVNRYDKAFEFFNKKNPSTNERLNNYNNKDGTNNLVKMIVELGVFALIIYLFFFLFLVNKKIPIEYKLFYLPFVVTQCLRGAGYFNGGFSLIVFFMLFTYLKLNKKNL